MTVSCVLVVIATARCLVIMTLQWKIEFNPVSDDVIYITITISFVYYINIAKEVRHNTERGGSVVTHETRIREVPGSNPCANQPDWFFFSWFSSIIKANAGLDFHYHDPFDHFSSNSYIIIKLKSVNLTNETLTAQHKKYTAFWYTPKDPKRDMTKML